MTEEEYSRMKNILNTIIEQQALSSERHTKAEARMDRNDRAITIHQQELACTSCENVN